jgi:hypothetical protein
MAAFTQLMRGGNDVSLPARLELRSTEGDGGCRYMLLRLSNT